MERLEVLAEVADKAEAKAGETKEQLVTDLNGQSQLLQRGLLLGWDHVAELAADVAACAVALACK
jgi:hypothetical protein